MRAVATKLRQDVVQLWHFCKEWFENLVLVMKLTGCCKYSDNSYAGLLCAMNKGNLSY